MLIYRSVHQRMAGVLPQGLFVLFALALGLQAPRSAAATTLPDSFSWRDNQGDFTSRVEDQDSSTCFNYATAGAIEAMAEIQLNDPDLDLDLSEQFLRSCYDGPQANIVEPSEVLDFIKSNQGIYTESCYRSASCSSAAASCQATAVEVESWHYVSKDTESIKQAVFEHGPVIAKMMVYDDFHSYDGGVYSHSFGGQGGVHFVVIVGWQEANGCWIVRNSWGRDWGEQGFFRIKYEDSGIQDQDLVAVTLVGSSEEPEPGGGTDDPEPGGGTDDPEPGGGTDSPNPGGPVDQGHGDDTTETESDDDRGGAPGLVGNMPFGCSQGRPRSNWNDRLPLGLLLVAGCLVRGMVRRRKLHRWRRT